MHWSSLKSVNQAYFVLKHEVVLEPLELGVGDLLEHDHEVRWLLAGSLVPFSLKGQLVLWAHSWFNVDHFGADVYLLALAIALHDDSLEVDCLLAAIVQLLKGALAGNGQVREPDEEGLHHARLLFGLEGAQLITVLVQGNSKWVCGSEEFFEDLEGVTLELVPSFEAVFLVWDSGLHEFFTVLVVDLLQFWSAEDLISFTNL